MSFDNLENTGTRKANLAILILFTFLALMVTYFLPFFGFVTLALLPLPSILLLLLGRQRDSIICAIAGTILLFLFDYALAAVAMLTIIALSFDYKYFFKKDRKVTLGIFSVFMIFIGAAVLYVLIGSLIAGKNIILEISGTYNDYISNMPDDPIVQTYRQLLVSNTVQFDAVLKQTQSFLKYLPKLLPAIFLVFFGATSLINYTAGTSFLRKYGVKLNELPKFSHWDISWYWCWGIILGIILVIIPQMNSGYDILIDAVGYNLIIIFGSIYIVLGASALLGIFERFNLPVFWKYFVLIIVIIIPGFIILLPVLGLIDVWANLRKLSRR